MSAPDGPTTRGDPHRPPGAGRGRRRHARARPGGPGRGGAVQDLRTAALLRGLLRGRESTRSPRHHGPDLRDLPDRLHEPVQRDGGAVRGRGARAGQAPPAARLLRRVDREPLLHTAMLHAPDFLGYDGGVEMARDHRELVETGLRLKKAGNRHGSRRRPRRPSGQRARGRLVPGARRADLAALVPELDGPAAGRVTRWVAGFDFPDFELDYGSWRCADARGSTRSSAAASSRARARHRRRRVRGAFRRGRRCRVRTPCTRRLPARRLSRRPAGPVRPQPPALASRPGGRLRGRPRRACRNPFRSIVVRAVETVYAATRRCASSRSTCPPSRPRRDGAARRHRARLHRGSAWDLLASVRDRRPRQDPRRQDRAADLAEPETIEEDLLGVRRGIVAPARRRACSPVRADDPQLRPVHLLRNPFPEARDRARVKAAACLGSRYRGDDAVGPLVADQLAPRVRPSSSARRADQAARRLGGARPGRDRGCGVVGRSRRDRPPCRRGCGAAASRPPARLDALRSRSPMPWTSGGRSGGRPCRVVVIARGGGGGWVMRATRSRRRSEATLGEVTESVLAELGKGEA